MDNSDDARLINLGLLIQTQVNPDQLLYWPEPKTSSIHSL